MTQDVPSPIKKKHAKRKPKSRPQKRVDPKPQKTSTENKSKDTRHTDQSSSDRRKKNPRRQSQRRRRSRSSVRKNNAFVSTSVSGNTHKNTQGGRHTGKQSAKLSKKPSQPTRNKNNPLAPAPICVPIKEIRKANPVGNKTQPALNIMENTSSTKEPVTLALEITHRCGIVFFPTFHKAKSSTATIKDMAQQYDQLNVVITEEGNMQDSELLSIHDRVVLFAGKAWETIHQRRHEEGWYHNHNIGISENSTQEAIRKQLDTQTASKHVT
ncbi:MAG: hypothetical protein OXC44_08275 [Proteobacteria bacterium]|nr:hypothetical protein [Pseudomonadota bacterium]